MWLLGFKNVEAYLLNNKHNIKMSECKILKSTYELRIKVKSATGDIKAWIDCQLKYNMD